ncbi:hypothetical protein HYH03_012145 [Edaphochlamys debaryana]|uniref:Protein kinase domain-containing protein n=1 Tax=Edaphochlamys debaryana TaxID=47281 RepID=A0A836BVR4_9CHLO|nr:hypothetical protein HYH03_012145 [Edaphochlamys debaryana]|eukprot:KAG2489313.1 hypothetical protein HYH03_012145 [Edaphochlamys debaryana]
MLFVEVLVPLVAAAALAVGVVFLCAQRSSAKTTHASGGQGAEQRRAAAGNHSAPIQAQSHNQSPAADAGVAVTDVAIAIHSGRPDATGQASAAAGPPATKPPLDGHNGRSPAAPADGGREERTAVGAPEGVAVVRAAGSVGGGGVATPESAASTLRDHLRGSERLWDEYQQRVNEMPLPAPRAAPTGSLVSAWLAKRQSSKELDPAQAVLGPLPMTPDEALARLTGTSPATAHGKDGSARKEKAPLKIPCTRTNIPGALTVSSTGGRSLKGVVGKDAAALTSAGSTPSLTPAGSVGVATDDTGSAVAKAEHSATAPPPPPAQASGAAAAAAQSAALAAPTALSVAAQLASGKESGKESRPGSMAVPPITGGIAPPPSLQTGTSNPPIAAIEDSVRMDIDLAELSMGQEIGRGGFGRVYAGTYMGQPVAVKMLLGAGGGALSELAALRLEVSILSRANHPNVIKIYGGNLSPPKPFIVAELLMCSLHDYIYHPQADTRTLLVVRLARGIAGALAYLHPAVLHRDLKPGNVLLSHEGEPKLADFGLARWKLKTLLSTQTLEAGSVPYLAPECFDPDNWHLTDRVDVYSMAVIMSELLMRRPPWHGMSSMQVAWEVHVQGRRPALPPPSAQHPLKLLQLIEQCWTQDPKKRPSASQVYVSLCELHDELQEQEAGAGEGPGPSNK